MKMLRVAVLCLLASGSAFAQSGGEMDGKVIYGDDDRLDLYQVTIPKLLELADSTVGLFSDDSVTIDGDIARLTTFDYGQRYNLCADEPFREQRSGAFCSGSLVGPDLIMTAGHCITSEASCSGTKFVFNFGIKEKGKLPETVKASDVYSCAKLVGRGMEDSGADWALIQVDRKVTGRKVLEIERGPDASNGTKLFVIGHPAGLPTKVAGGAKVRDNSPAGYFVANLDTYGGNSGSAVFNAVTGKIEGILVRGETDYTWRGSCRVSYQCPDEGCRGEDVTKISALSQLIPAPALGEGFRARSSPRGGSPAKPGWGAAFKDLQRWSGEGSR